MTDDLFDQIGLGHLFGIEGADDRPISNDGDPIGEGKYFVQIVRNKQYAGTLSLNASGQAKQSFDVSPGQKWSGFVKNQQPFGLLDPVRSRGVVWLGSS